MMNSKQALKNLKQLQEQEKQFPNAHIYTNIKNMGLDMKELAKNNPYLFEMFTRIFSGIGEEENIQLWKNYEQAYKELDEQGVLTFKATREEDMKSRVKDFSDKVNGGYLVPLEEINDLVTEKKRKGEVSIQVEFNEYMHLLEKYYEFEYRDFFKMFGNKSENDENSRNIKSLGWTKKDYDKYAKISPAKHINAAKIAVLTDMYKGVNGMPYVDYWHYLLDRDFTDISNGSVAIMWNEGGEDDDFGHSDFNEAVKVTDTPLINELFADIRKVIFKEITQYPYYKGEVPEEIEFSISW